MGMSAGKLAACLLTLIPVMAVVQEAVTPLSELQPQLQRASEFTVVELTLSTTQYHMSVQTVFSENTSEWSVRRQDTVYSLDPKRDGQGPLSFRELLELPVSHNV